MTINHLYARYLNEYNTWSKQVGARISAELYETHFTIKVTKPGKILPLLKVYAEHYSEDKIRITHRQGLSKNTVYVTRT